MCVCVLHDVSNRHNQFVTRHPNLKWFQRVPILLSHESVYQVTTLVIILSINKGESVSRGKPSCVQSSIYTIYVMYYSTYFNSLIS